MSTQFTSAPASTRGSYGFSLIEILVALAISGIILTGIFYVFNTSNKSYIVQEDVARMQQNVRIAKYYIERDLRMAGYGTKGLFYAPESNYEDEDEDNYGLIDPVFFENNINDPDDPNEILSGTDSITITYIDDAESECDPDGTGTHTACDELLQLSLNGEMPESSSVADVNEKLSTLSYISWTNPCSCNGIDYEDFGYQVIITSPDGSQSDLVYLTKAKITGGGTEDTLQNHPYEGFDNKILNTYPQNSTINFFNYNTFLKVRYFIDNENYLRGEKNGIANKVAENIEDIQVAFCGDYNGDDTVDIADTTDWYDEADLDSNGEMSPEDKAKIRYARITIVGRTAREHGGIASTRPTVEDHAGATQADYYLRRVLSFTVKIRNLDL